MRLTILTQYYPPEMGAPQVRLSEIARHFVARGHEVTVLTAMPNYPTGRVFAGYGRWLHLEERDGVRIVRTWIHPTRDARLAPRLTSYLSFAASSALVGAALGRSDFLMVESPPLFLGLSGMWLAAARRTRLIFNVSDLWPESAARLGVVGEGSAAYKAASILEGACYRRAWLVTGQSRGILASIGERFPAVPTRLLTNGVDTRRFGRAAASAEARRQLDPDGGRFVVLYAGLHGLAQGLGQLLDAALRLRSDPRFRFVLVGDGAEIGALVAQAADQGLSNVVFRAAVPSAEIPALLASADALVVPLVGDLPGAVPSKLYEAMASERPVLLVACGEPAAILEDAAAGWVRSPGDVAGIVSALEEIAAGGPEAEARVARARGVVERHYDRATIAGAFVDTLEQALVAGGTPPG